MLSTRDTPRKTRLYNAIAKDYLPKQAEMMICRYIEEMEARIDARLSELERANSAAELASGQQKPARVVKQKAEERQRSEKE